MDMTTKERIYIVRGINDPDATLDAQVEQMITNVSARFAAALGRHVLDSGYSETYEMVRAGKVVWLRGYPVGSISSIKYSETSDATDSTELEEHTDYYLDAEAGIIRLRKLTPYSHGYLAVSYTGGMSTTVDLFVNAWPDIAAVCDQQVVHELNRRNTPGSDIQTRDGKTSFGSPEINLLKGVREVLGMYSRTVL